MFLKRWLDLLEHVLELLFHLFGQREICHLVLNPVLDLLHVIIHLRILELLQDIADLLLLDLLVLLSFLALLVVVALLVLSVLLAQRSTLNNERQRQNRE